MRECLINIAVESYGVNGFEVMKIEWWPAESVGIAGEFVIVEANWGGIGE